MSLLTLRAGARRRLGRLVPAILLLTLVVACGGGREGTTGSPPPLGASPPASVSVGAITGFGSVHLNGRQFETTSAAITIDGQSATQADLRVGEVIEVRGHHDDASNHDIADAIEMRGNVEGPVSAIDPVAGTLGVLGQTVLVTADTSFDDDISPASLAGLAVGDIVEVSGLPAASGAIEATRIEKKAAGASFHVIGTASATDSVAKTLKINALTVDFTTATLVDFPAAGPADGDLIEATGSTLTTTGTLTATRLELRTGKGLKGDVDGAGEIEGLITRFASATDFDVGGRPVSTSATTTFDGGSAADLALDLKVEAEGTVDAAGVLVATRIRIEHAATQRILAEVDAVDATGGTVTLLGIQVSVGAMTRFEDHGPGHVSTFSLADVHTGDWLEVRGSETPAGSHHLAATRLERRTQQPAVRLAGPVGSAAPPNLAILGVTVATTATTQFRDATGATVTAVAFFAAGPVGQVVGVTGSWDGTTLTATEAAFGEADDDGGGGED